jgi:ABC-type multidrug transport system fused ATPase/permease subunit
MATSLLSGRGITAAPGNPAKAGTPPHGLPRLLTGDRRGLFWRLVGNGVLQAAVTLSIPLAVQRLVVSDAPLPLLLGLSAAAFLLLFLRIVEVVDAERLGQRYVTEVRLALFDAVLDGRSKASHGVTMTRLLNDLTALKNWVGLGVARSAVAATALAGCLLAAAFLEGRLGLVLLLPTAAVIVAAALTARPLRRRVGTVRRERGRLASRLGSVLLTLELVRNFGSGPKARARIVRASERLSRALEARMWPTGLLRALPQLVLPAVIVLVSVLPITASGSDILVIVLLAGLATGPLAAAARALEYHAAYAVARERLTPALLDPERRHGAPGQSASAWPAEALPGRPAAWLGAIEAWLVPPEQGAAGWIVVSDRQPLPAGTLQAVIDVTGRFQQSQRRLMRVVEACALDDQTSFPAGLATPLEDGAAGLSRSLAARLRLARGAAMKTTALVVDDPVVVIDPACRAAVERLAAALDLAVLVAWPSTVPVPDGWVALCR